MYSGVVWGLEEGAEVGDEERDCHADEDSIVFVVSLLLLESRGDDMTVSEPADDSTDDGGEEGADEKSKFNESE